MWPFLSPIHKHAVMHYSIIITSAFVVLQLLTCNGKDADLFPTYPLTTWLWIDSTRHSMSRAVKVVLIAPECHAIKEQRRTGEVLFFPFKKSKLGSVMASSLARLRNEGHSHWLETLIGERNYSGILWGHLKFTDITTTLVQQCSCPLLVEP